MIEILMLGCVSQHLLVIEMSFFSLMIFKGVEDVIFMSTYVNVCFVKFAHVEHTHKRTCCIFARSSNLDSCSFFITHSICLYFEMQAEF